MKRMINGRVKQIQKRIDNLEDEQLVHSISDLAKQIQADWRKPYFGAVPYIVAMRQIHLISDRYYEESAKDVVVYFLANAQTWRGEEARRIKAILNKLVNEN